MTDVFCVIEHLHRDRAVAEEVAAGRFTLAGETRALGTEPDWLTADLPADEEWRLDWVKFYYGLDLASAYRDTGDARFLEAWERLVGSWIDTVPPDSDASEVTARRILNWIYAWQGFAGADGDFEPELYESLRAQARHVRANLTPERNHRTLELYSLFIAGLAVPGLRGLIGFALDELGRNLAADFRPDGVHRESSTHYHMIALRSFVGAAENARRFGLELPAGFEARLGRALDFALHCTRPDGAIPALSDSDGGRYGELLALAGGLVGRPPTRLAASFPDGGYHVQRSGWDADARFLIFDCGPLGDGGHGHYDLLSIEAFAGGRPLVVDPGRGSYSEGPPNLRRWFRSTAAHNTVCVDGLDQTPYTRGRPAGPVAEGRFLGRETRNGLDVVVGEARSPAYEVVHRRRIAFVADRFWLIEDRLRGERPHRYDLRFHLAPAAEARIEGQAVLAPGLALVVDGAPVALEGGWVAPEYGRLQPAPVVTAAVESVRETTFLTLLAPGRLPSFAVRREGGGTTALVDGRWAVAFGEDPCDVRVAEPAPCDVRVAEPAAVDRRVEGEDR
jgi:hypothetical protein